MDPALSSIWVASHLRSARPVVDTSVDTAEREIAIYFEESELWEHAMPDAQWLTESVTVLVVTSVRYPNLYDEAWASVGLNCSTVE